MNDADCYVVKLSSHNPYRNSDGNGSNQLSRLSVVVSSIVDTVS